MKRIICTVINDLNYDQRMMRICSTLHQAGFDVLLIGRQLPDSKPLRTQIFHQKRLHCFFHKGKFFYIEYNIRLFFFLLFNPFNVVNSVDLDTLVAGFFVAKLKKKVCTFDAHEYFSETPEVVHRPFTKMIWEKVATLTIPKLKHCYTVGDGLAKLFSNLYHVDFQTIRNVPFLESTIQKELPKEKKIILYQGALNEGRGIEASIEAMQWVNGATLYLVGEGDLSKILREKVIHLGLEEKVLFLGYKMPNELKDITKQASIGLNLLENKGLSYYYSLANKFFDYVQAEIPSLNMNFPEYAALNQQYDVSVLLDTLDPKILAQTLERLLNDENLRQKLIQNAKIAKLEWNWENEKEKIIQLYRNLI